MRSRKFIFLFSMIHFIVSSFAQDDCRFSAGNYFIPDCNIDTCLQGWFYYTEGNDCQIVSQRYTVYNRDSSEIIFDKEESWHGQVEGKNCYHHPGSYPYKIQLKTIKGKEIILTGKVELILMHAGSICDTSVCEEELRSVRRLLNNKDTASAKFQMERYLYGCIYGNRDKTDPEKLFGLGKDFYEILPTRALLDIFWNYEHTETEEVKYYKGLVIRQVMKENLLMAVEIMGIDYNNGINDKVLYKEIEEYLKSQGY